MTENLRALRHRKGVTWWVVRDATREIRHTGRTRHEALTPFNGRVTKRTIKGGKRVHSLLSSGITPLRRYRLWLFLYRHGWRVARELHPDAVIKRPLPPAAT